jgi:hypothetical protein
MPKKMSAMVAGMNESALSVLRSPIWSAVTMSFCAGVALLAFTASLASASFLPSIAWTPEKIRNFEGVAAFASAYAAGFVVWSDSAAKRSLP